MMNKKRWIVLGRILTAVLAATALGVRAVYADGATPPAPPDGRGPALDGRPWPPRLGPEALEVAAGVLGMTTDELSAELTNGTTLEELATQKGVDIEAVPAALQAAHKAQMLEDIKQAVADGKMTQDKADWLIVGLEKGYLEGPGFGFGLRMPFGGPRGERGSVPEATPQP